MCQAGSTEALGKGSVSSTVNCRARSVQLGGWPRARVLFYLNKMEFFFLIKEAWLLLLGLLGAGVGSGAVKVRGEMQRGGQTLSPNFHRRLPLSRSPFQAGWGPRGAASARDGSLWAGGAGRVPSSPTRVRSARRCAPERPPRAPPTS